MRLTPFGRPLDIDDDAVDASPDDIRRQVAAYERGERRAFDLPVRIPEGFTGRVVEAMLAIPYGETRTYGDVAAALETSPVAVGGGCGRNPVPLVVPCHRVVAADGPGGYSGAGGVALKRRLLAHESAAVSADRGP